MAMIRLTDSYQVIPEGTYIFKVSEVDYNDEFGKLVIKFETKDGKKLNEMFSFVRADGSVNSGAMNSFSYLARVCMNDMNAKEIDPTTLTGHYIKATVTHTQSADGTRTFAHLGEKLPAEGWDDDGAIDLDSLLG